MLPEAQAGQNAKPTAAASVRDLVPPASWGVLQGKEWFRKWADSPVKASADNPASHASRLALLSAGKDLTDEERRALDRILDHLKKAARK